MEKIKAKTIKEINKSLGGISSVKKIITKSYNEKKGFEYIIELGYGDLDLYINAVYKEGTGDLKTQISRLIVDNVLIFGSLCTKKDEKLGRQYLDVALDLKVKMKYNYSMEEVKKFREASSLGESVDRIMDRSGDLLSYEDVYKECIYNLLEQKGL